ncbi:hypothetical protein [Catenulispora subtropica]|uniref:Uncharacterized protein n=1 Tax=Catenulispora subtropica TaxID=450798 RepID=A0ABN2S1L6_9ACTN
MRGALARALERAWSGPGVRDLLDRAAGRPAGDVVALASLTATHLLAFAGGEQALWDAPVERAWSALSVPEKWRIQRTGLESFRSERWLAWDGTEGGWNRRLTVDPALALIMRARTSPRSVVTLQIKGMMPAVRAYAIDHGAELPQCYLAEMPDRGLTASVRGWDNPFHWCYRYGVVARDGLVRLVKEYAVMPIAEDSPFAGQPRLISAYVPPVREQNLVTRFEVRGGEVPSDLEAVVAGLLAVRVPTPPPAAAP